MCSYLGFDNKGLYKIINYFCDHFKFFGSLADFEYCQKYKASMSSIYTQISDLGLALKIKYHKLSYLSAGGLLNLSNQVRKIEEKKIEGIILEAGCALGGSTIQIGKAKSIHRKFYIYDVFGMIPEPSEKDGEDVQNRYKEIIAGKSKGLRGDTYYGYQDDLLGKIIGNMKKFELDPADHLIYFIKGLYSDTIKINEPVALAHIDCDWYDSVITCLENIIPHLSKGGCLVIDDYYTWSGCSKAVDDFFDQIKDQFYFSTNSNKLNIVRTK